MVAKKKVTTKKMIHEARMNTFHKIDALYAKRKMAQRDVDACDKELEENWKMIEPEHEFWFMINGQCIYIVMAKTQEDALIKVSKELQEKHQSGFKIQLMVRESGKYVGTVVDIESYI